MTTDDVAACLSDFRDSLVADAIAKQRPVEQFVTDWMGPGTDVDCSREEFVEALAHMVGERVAPRKIRTAPVVEFGAPVG